MRSPRKSISSVVCPRSECPSRAFDQVSGPKSLPKVRKRGFFLRRYPTRKRIPRFYCLLCRRSFSQATLEPEYRQQKRHWNEATRKLLCSGVSQRRAARLLGLDRKTIARKLLFLGLQAKEDLESGNRSLKRSPVTHLQFDEMETFEHTKCKPLSIPLAVCAKTRRILDLSVASMPASGLLARKAREKYGPRKDERAEKARELLGGLRDFISPEAQVTTDQKTLYPLWLKPHFPRATHRAVKGRRGCIVGQGELKKIGFDPLFSLNHTAAMIRANVNRLFRRTWCTTKRKERLLAHLYLYAQFHNRELIAQGAGIPGGGTI